MPASGCIGLFQKISTHPPYGRHWIGYLTISGFPRKTTAVFAGFQSLLIQNLEEFQNFCKSLNGFPGIPVKIKKKFGEIGDFQSYWPSISYRISNVVHGGGGVWIFSGIAHYHERICVFTKLLHNTTKRNLRKVPRNFLHWNGRQSAE